MAPIAQRQKASSAASYTAAQFLKSNFGAALSAPKRTIVSGNVSYSKTPSLRKAVEQAALRRSTQQLDRRTLEMRKRLAERAMEQHRAAAVRMEAERRARDAEAKVRKAMDLERLAPKIKTLQPPEEGATVSLGQLSDACWERLKPKLVMSSQGILLSGSKHPIKFTTK